jgi:hypothetical protein
MLWVYRMETFELFYGKDILYKIDRNIIQVMGQRPLKVETHYYHV